MLLWYDGPQIVLFEIDSTRYVVAVVIADGQFEGQFLGAVVNKTQLSDYQIGKFDLRFLLTHPAFREWCRFSYSDSETVDLFKVGRTDVLIIDNAPEPGLFARSHNDITLIALDLPTTDERIEIDGNWEFKELSKFYGQVEDIYYIYNVMERFRDPATPQNTVRAIKQAFVRPFQGGGSYLGLYGSIANDNDDPSSKLRFGGISYNSPGYVRVKARQKPFNHMIELVQNFSRNLLSIRKSYNELHKYLSSLGLLSADSNTILTESVMEGVELYSKALCHSFGNISYGDLIAISEQNTLIASKVCLSIYRRADKLNNFFAEGRASYKDLDVQVGDMLLD